MSIAHPWRRTSCCWRTKSTNVLNSLIESSTHLLTCSRVGDNEIDKLRNELASVAGSNLSQSQKKNIELSNLNNKIMELGTLFTHSLTYSLTHLLTHSLTHSLTYSLTHSLTHSLTKSLSLTYSLVCRYPTNSPKDRAPRGAWEGRSRGYKRWKAQVWIYNKRAKREIRHVFG